MRLAHGCMCWRVNGAAPFNLAATAQQASLAVTQRRGRQSQCSHARATSPPSSGGQAPHVWLLTTIYWLTWRLTSEQALPMCCSIISDDSLLPAAGRWASLHIAAGHTTPVRPASDAGQQAMHLHLWQMPQLPDASGQRARQVSHQGMSANSTVQQACRRWSRREEGCCPGPCRRYHWR